jgi:uncharacterized protein (TIGR00251 family)
MVTSTPKGVLLDVRVAPRAAGRPGLAGAREGIPLIRLHAAPVDGAANAELIELLSGMLGIPRRAVTIVHGERGRVKRVSLQGVSVELVRSILKLG